MTNFDARLQAQLQHLDASIPLARLPDLSATGRIARLEPARRRRRRSVVVLLAAAALLVATSAVVGQRPTYPDIPVPALEAAIVKILTGSDCLSPADADSAIRATLDEQGYPDWDIQHAGGFDTARCVSAGIVVPDHLVVLLAAAGRGVLNALDGVRDELMRQCLGKDAAIAFVRSVLAGIGRGDIAVSADPWGPRAAPIDQFEAYQAHVAAGCYVYAGIQNGNRVDLWGP